MLDKTFDDVAGWETQNMLTVARLVVTAALARERSLGVHHRTDDEDAADVSEKRHIVIQCSTDGLQTGSADLHFDVVAWRNVQDRC